MTAPAEIPSQLLTFHAAYEKKIMWDTGVLVQYPRGSRIGHCPQGASLPPCCSPAWLCIDGWPPDSGLCFLLEAEEFLPGLKLSGPENATTAYTVMVLFALQSLWLCQSVLWHCSSYHTASVSASCSPAQGNKSVEVENGAFGGGHVNNQHSTSHLQLLFLNPKFLCPPAQDWKDLGLQSLLCSSH